MSDSLQQWEYRILTVDVTDVPSVEDRLIRLGEEGWELVSYQRDGTTTDLALKRPIVR